MTSAEIGARLAEVRDRIGAASARAGRAASDVRIVAVTKTHPPALVRAAAEAGLGDFGENRVQELDEKVRDVGRSAGRWHLIGHLQRNKAARALPLFDLFHALDSLRLAEALSEAAGKSGTTVRALVQVNTSGEESKFGLGPEEAVEVVARMAQLPALRLEGMMTMAPFTADEAVIRRTFTAARRLCEDTERQVPGFSARQLSMGMSNDYEIAAEEGSTLVRLGSVLFGDRGT